MNPDTKNIENSMKGNVCERLGVMVDVPFSEITHRLNALASTLAVTVGKTIDGKEQTISYVEDKLKKSFQEPVKEMMASQGGMQR